MTTYELCPIYLSPELLVLPPEPGEPFLDTGRDVLQHTAVRLIPQFSAVLGAALTSLYKDSLKDTHLNAYTCVNRVSSGYKGTKQDSLG